MKKYIKIIVILLLVLGVSIAVLIIMRNKNNDNLSKYFIVDYDNEKGERDIVGKIKRSEKIRDGLSSGIKIRNKKNNNSDVTSTIKLRINTNTNPALTTTLLSYCEIENQNQDVSNKSLCTNAGGIWHGYKDDYCENPETLERMTEYDNEDDCINNNGEWVNVGTPLKYALYDSLDENATPINMGYITTGDIGNYIILKDNVSVPEEEQLNLYIYIWLDSYMTNETYDNLYFSSSIFVIDNIETEE